MASFSTYLASDSAPMTTRASSASSTAMQTPDGSQSQLNAHTGAEDDPSKKKKPAKRRKVNHACLYCRRSHMTCDEGRPCQRCIKREIGHLCHDERRPKVGDKPGGNSPAASASPTVVPPPVAYAPVYPPAAAPVHTAPATTWPIPVASYLYPPETFGNEFSVLTDFLETLDENAFFTPPTAVAPSVITSASFTTANILNGNSTTSMTTTSTINQSAPPPTTSLLTQAQQSVVSPTVTPSTSTPMTSSITTTTASSNEPTDNILPSATKAEKFLLTAADQESGSRDERLNRVIRSKYEAGLLKPYNYVKGYARLSRWMDRNVSQESKQQILQPLSVLRPKFRAVAQSLRDMDLVFIEEAFERMLLDYDRVFSAMGVPACLWRRTGEIYKGNREFSELVGVDGYMLRDGRLCIYELMAEESAVNYWEKYGHVAFDSSQKAVLTSCVLRYKPVLGSGSSSPVISKAVLSGSASTPAAPSTPSKREEDSDGVEQFDEQQQPMEEDFINCCFSFTIRRDKWGIPSMIVGNFIRC